MEKFRVGLLTVSWCLFVCHGEVQGGSWCLFVCHGEVQGGSYSQCRGVCLFVMEKFRVGRGVCLFVMEKFRVGPTHSVVVFVCLSWRSSGWVLLTVSWCLFVCHGEVQGGSYSQCRGVCLFVMEKFRVGPTHSVVVFVCLSWRSSGWVLLTVPWCLFVCHGEVQGGSTHSAVVLVCVFWGVGGLFWVVSFVTELI